MLTRTIIKFSARTDVSAKSAALVGRHAGLRTGTRHGARLKLCVTEGYCKACVVKSASEMLQIGVSTLITQSHMRCYASV